MEPTYLLWGDSSSPEKAKSMVGPFEQWQDNTDLTNEHLQFELLCFHKDRLYYLFSWAKPNQSKTKMHSCPEEGKYKE